MHIPHPRAKRRARIEIIPLIDIMFFLLATFVMVSLSMIKNQTINVHLPVASSSHAEERKKYVSVTVTDKSEFFWNKEAVALPEIILRLQQLKTAEPDPKVFSNGDAKAHFEDVITILDEARKIGITKVAIETEKKQ